MNAKPQISRGLGEDTRSKRPANDLGMKINLDCKQEIGETYPDNASGNLLSNSKQSMQPNFEPKPCKCPVEPSTQPPFYNHLGSGPNVKQLREGLEERFKVTGHALRIESVRYTSKEGKNREGCPVAKWVLRRNDAEEKVLVVVRERPGHSCEDSVIIISIVVWEGFEISKANYLYQRLTNLLSEHATMVTRRCGTNETKNCCCQGNDSATCGASFSFGCSWSMFYNGCKFGNSSSPRKFRIQQSENETEVTNLLEGLATEFGPKCKMFAPKAFNNMTYYDSVASQCRIGQGEKRPFSGLTCCLDFCAHSHKDLQNMNHGTTMVLTLLRKGSTQATGDANEGVAQGIDKEEHLDDEQLHVLPLYQLVNKDGTVCDINYQMPRHTLKSTTVPREKDLKKPCKSKRIKRCSADDTTVAKYRTKLQASIEILNHVTPSNEKGKGEIENWKSTAFESSVLPLARAFKVLPEGQSIVSSLEEDKVGDQSTIDQIIFVNESKIPSVNSNSLHNSRKVSRTMPFKPNKLPGSQQTLRDMTECQPAMFHQEHQQPYTFGDGSISDGKIAGIFQNRTGAFNNNQYQNIDMYFPTLPGNTSGQDALVENADLVEIDLGGFITREMGGVGIALTHGSVLIECAKKELHATTALRRPQRQNPTRLSIIFYQHKQLNLPNHGYEENKKKVLNRQRMRTAKAVGAVTSSQQSFDSVSFPLNDLQLLANAASAACRDRKECDEKQNCPLPLQIGNYQKQTLHYPTKGHFLNSVNQPESFTTPNLGHPFQMHAGAYARQHSAQLPAFDTVVRSQSYEQQPQVCTQYENYRWPAMQFFEQNSVSPVEPNAVEPSLQDSRVGFTKNNLNCGQRGCWEFARPSARPSARPTARPSARPTARCSATSDAFKSPFSISSLLGLAEADRTPTCSKATPPSKPPWWMSGSQSQFADPWGNGCSTAHLSDRTLEQTFIDSEIIHNNQTNLWQASNQLDSYEQQQRQSFNDSTRFEKDYHLLRSANKILLSKSSDLTVNGNQLKNLFMDEKTELSGQSFSAGPDAERTSFACTSNQFWPDNQPREAQGLAPNGHCTYAMKEGDNHFGSSSLAMYQRNLVAFDNTNSNSIGNLDYKSFETNWYSRYRY